VETVSKLAGDYITFRIARQDFVMRAERVRGLLAAHELVTLESFSTESWICGVASLRAREFPVVDLRGKLGIAHGSHGREPLIVAIEVLSVTGMQRMLGFVADRVSEVLPLRERDFRRGSVRIAGRSRRILDPDSILTEQDWSNWTMSLMR
jgi:chemotaxis signal transduction protein